MNVATCFDSSIAATEPSRNLGDMVSNALKVFHGSTTKEQLESTYHDEGLRAFYDEFLDELQDQENSEYTVSKTTIGTVKNFIFHLLPTDLPLPDIYLDGEGWPVLEWCKGNREFSLYFNERDIYYVGLYKVDDREECPKGNIARLPDELPPDIRYYITRVFEIESKQR